MKTTFFLLADNPDQRLEVIQLKATTLDGATKEMHSMNQSGAIADALIIAADELHELHVAIERSLGLKASCHWHASDVKDIQKDLTLEQAEEWLDKNAKYIAEASVKAGFEAMEFL